MFHKYKEDYEVLKLRKKKKIENHQKFLLTLSKVGSYLSFSHKSHYASHAMVYF